jgi:NADH-quinone oxidoreductase subunit H
VFVMGLVLGMAVPLLVYFERKIAAWVQDRTGPNRVGPFGILQPAADVIKFFFKEDVTPGKAHRVLFALAPCLEVFTAIIALATMPFGHRLGVAGQDVQLIIADLDIGILWIFAIGSLAVYGILLAGWSSASHFAFMGGLRSSAQIISYEIALTLSVVGVLLVSGSLRLTEIVAQQSGFGWNAFTQPIGCLVFLVAMFAETNRNPFDLPEAESELVAGYHTEYSSMRFAMFFMAEYIAMITMSALMVTLFFGGWQFLFLFIIIRWTLPRMRYDQLMHLGWKGILPLALLQLFASSVREVWGNVPYGILMATALAGVVWFMTTPRSIPPGRVAVRPEPST